MEHLYFVFSQYTNYIIKIKTLCLINRLCHIQTATPLNFSIFFTLFKDGKYIAERDDRGEISEINDATENPRQRSRHQKVSARKQCPEVSDRDDKTRSRRLVWTRRTT